MCGSRTAHSSEEAGNDRGAKGLNENMYRKRLAVPLGLCPTTEFSLSAETDARFSETVPPSLGI